MITGNSVSTLEEAEEITISTLGGNPLSQYETVRYRKDGTPVHIRLSSSPIFIEGAVAGVVGVYTDISQQKSTESELKELLAQKEFLIKEINHRVKNNLTMISSLINLKSITIGDSVDLSDLQHQIDTIRIVHEKLHTSNDVTNIYVRDYIEELLQTIFSSFSIKPVFIEHNSANTVLPTKQAIPLGLIINEIATNAIKHGFVDEDEPRFSVSFQEDPEGDCYVLTLSNTGKPFPEDIDIDTSDSLGLRLISALIDQIDGNLEIQRRPYPVFIISFPR